MANINVKKGVIGILTGGGDVPGLNPAIRGGVSAARAARRVSGDWDTAGWGGLVDMVREKDYDNSDNFSPPKRTDCRSRRTHRRNFPTFFADQSRAREPIERAGASEG